MIARTTAVYGLVAGTCLLLHNATIIAANGAEGLRITGTGNINGRAREFMTGYDKPNEWWLPKPFRPKMFVRCV